MSIFEDKLNEVNNWISNVKKVVDSLPQVNDIYQEYLDLSKLMNKFPEDQLTLREKVENKLTPLVSTLADSLGPQPIVNMEMLNLSGMTASSGSAILLDEVQKYSWGDKSKEKEFRTEIFSYVSKIQVERKMVEHISRQLHYIFEPIGNEFDEIVILFGRYQAKIESPSSFGIKMRNVLEHFKGICNQSAIIIRMGSNVKLKDSLTWNKISEVIAQKGKGSKYDHQFSMLTKTWENLWEDLTKYAKDYDVEDRELLIHTYIELLQYLDASLKLIDVYQVMKACKQISGFEQPE